MFKKRDFKQSKIFKVACRYWDPPRSRKRVIYAEGMQRVSPPKITPQYHGSVEIQEQTSFSKPIVR